MIQANRHKQLIKSKRDELARQFMYTSVQQAAFDEIPWGIYPFTKLLSHLKVSFFVLSRFEITIEVTSSRINV